MKLSVQPILQKQMSRKEFLLYVGLFLLALTGITNILDSLHTAGKPTKSPQFGYGPYGGKG